MSLNDCQECDIEGFLEKAGLSFQETALLEEALTHRSYVNEHRNSDLPDNQRLEFLGDAVLDLLVGEWLYHRYPNAREGQLTRLRAMLVRNQTLASFAREIDLGTFLLLGRGEEAGGGRSRRANLCAAFEAVVGAVYLDRGLEYCRKWVGGFLAAHAPDVDKHMNTKDHKSQLQEVIQATRHVTPAYDIVGSIGPDHDRVFTAQVIVNDQVLGQGQGSTKQDAEQDAARDAIDHLEAQTNNHSSGSGSVCG